MLISHCLLTDQCLSAKELLDRHSAITMPTLPGYKSLHSLDLAVLHNFLFYVGAVIASSVWSFSKELDPAQGGKERMPRGDKSSYTDKQKRKAEHIAECSDHKAEASIARATPTEAGSGVKTKPRPKYEAMSQAKS